MGRCHTGSNVIEESMYINVSSALTGNRAELFSSSPNIHPTALEQNINFSVTENVLHGLCMVASVACPSLESMLHYLCPNGNVNTWLCNNSFA